MLCCMGVKTHGANTDCLSACEWVDGRVNVTQRRAVVPLRGASDDNVIKTSFKICSSHKLSLG